MIPVYICDPLKMSDVVKKMLASKYHTEILKIDIFRQDITCFI